MKTYCVATAVIQDGNRYFIAKRANTKKIAPGLWEFVTGFVEDHETAEDTILREMDEEINAKGAIVRELDILLMHRNDERWIVIPFLVHVTHTTIETTPEEHSTGKWVTWEELSDLPVAEFRYDADLLGKALRNANLLSSPKPTVTHTSAKFARL